MIAGRLTNGAIHDENDIVGLGDSCHLEKTQTNSDKIDSIDKIDKRDSQRKIDHIDKTDKIHKIENQHRGPNSKYNDNARCAHSFLIEQRRRTNLLHFVEQGRLLFVTSRRVHNNQLCIHRQQQ